MPRPINKLSVVTIKALTKAGRHSDGGGLYLNIAKGGSKSWVFLWAKRGTRREMGLGPYPAVSLAAARQQAEKNRQTLGSGGDPLLERDKQAEPTFGGRLKPPIFS